MSEELMAKCSCNSCGNHIEFPIDAAGVTVSCPHCSQSTELSLQAPTPSPHDGRSNAADIVAAFGPPVPRTRTSFLYHIGLMLVSATMLVLPLIYIAMIGAAAWGVYRFGEHFAWMLTPRGNARLYILQLAFYFGALFIGAVLVLFMIKPLFARRPKSAQPLALNPAVEPTLFAFIAKICDSVGAPMPRRIDLDCSLNAAAGFRRGGLSMFGNDLVLTIGLPLVAALNARELGGVIAHEFGHFTQGFGMRLSYVVRSINAWFSRVVYERDRWDVWLAGVAEDSEDWRVMIVGWLAVMAVGFTRLLLGILMYIGHGISCFLLRQMEYDADSYEIKVAGSAAFESTARKMAVFAKCLEPTYKQMRAAYRSRCSLPADFPGFLLQQCARMPADQRAMVEDTLGLSTTGMFDTHPSDGDRIRCARRAAQPGIFALEFPATQLFSNFEVASRQVTQLHYTDDLGIEINPAQLVPLKAWA